MFSFSLSRKFLRHIAFLTASAAAAGMLSGCGGKDTSGGEPVSVEIWHYYNGSLQSSFDKMIENFNNTVGAENNITVSAHSQGSIADLETAVLSSANKQVGSGELPNIFASYADTAYEIEKMGILADLDQYFTAEEQAEYIDSYIEEGRIGSGGELYIFPIAKCTETFMLNKTEWDAFAEATGATAEGMRTVEGITDTARRYYEWTDAFTPDIPGDGKALYGRDALANLFIIGSKQLGHEIFHVENGSVTVDLDESAMRRIWDNYYVPYISGYFRSDGKYRSDDVKVGNIISLIGSTSSAVYFPDEVTDDHGTHAVDAEILPMPVFEGGQAVSVQQGAGMVVTKSTPEEEAAAVQFLKWFTEPENNIAFSAESGYLPVKKEANDYNYYKETAEKLGIEVVGTNDTVIREAFSRISETELYTSKAFDGCQEARSILEKSLADKAAKDRAAVVDHMKLDMSLGEAVALYNTDENFAEWFAQLKADINAAIDNG
ncbi:MAG: extracellular solute-binding protein [Oscillospiraceae bacterium]|nr:extracellular solute-binding protein [Oscillospiraceae bacterium]